jgi:effector-binding domain-containing protein
MKKLFTLILMVVVIAACSFAQEAEKKATPDAKATPTVEKTKSDAPATASGAAKMKGEIAVKTIPAQRCATLYMRAGDFAPKGGYKADPAGFAQAYSDMTTNGFTALMKWMTEAKVTPTGPAFGIYFEDPSKVKSPADLTCKLGFPVAEDTKGSGEINIDKISEKSCAVVQYEGAYDQTSGIWNALSKWIKDNNYTESGAPKEVYLKGPHDTQNPSEYLTEIQQPVKKTEKK